MNLREINSTDLASYHTSLHGMLSEIVAFARKIGHDAPVINMTMSAPTLQTPINGVLTPGNHYDVDSLMDQFERVLQSNEQLLSDEAVEIDATVAMNRQGGGRRRKLTDLAVDQVIKKKKTNLFCPINLSNQLCFSICLARFLNPQLPESELEKLAVTIQNSGFSIQDRIALSDIALLERALGIKIVVFHRSNAMVLETYKNCDELHPKTVFLYLHDDHYYMIMNLTGFLGSPYVCQFCYKSYTTRRDHRCKQACNVCFDAECHRFPKRTIHCHDCLRYCKSSYCFEMHKKNPPPGQESPSCDIIKYCKLCSWRYYVKAGDKKTKHICVPDKCVHCRERLTGQGSHQCFIHPLEPKEPCEKYIFYDFETRYENGRHVANFIKYCKLCGWRYYVKAGDKKTKHICAPDKCVHCRERLTGQGSHQCFIHPLEPKEPCEKYIFYDFETRYENGRHVANFVCAITFKGNKFTAEGTDCIAKLINRFRHPRYNGYCFIAHYASRFDAFLIL